ncbi:hypothetical protein P153DRAFT_273341, partial [Dothidotthia symphoricarpi CBS 119687]
MCFYDQYRFACGDWKWGHFQQQCRKRSGPGETCGMKLIMQILPTGRNCKLCEKIATKMRRRAAEVDRIDRWQMEGHKFRASINKSMEMIRGLDSEIYELSCERNRRLHPI